jgi:hypothetical protein
MQGPVARRNTYKKPKSELFVEIEAALNAEHWVEPESEMHPWAMAPGVAARRDRRVVLVLIRGRRCVPAGRALLDGIAGSRRASRKELISAARWWRSRSSRSSPPTCRWDPVMFRRQRWCLKFTYSRPCVAPQPPNSSPKLTLPAIAGVGPPTETEADADRIPTSMCKDDDEMGETRW